jgi:ATP-dependent RNA helicase DDX41
MGVSSMADPPAAKRRRTARSLSPVYNLNEDEDYQPYIPVEKRRQERLSLLKNRRGPETKQERDRREREEREEDEANEREEERQKEKVRRERALLLEAQEVHLRKAAEGKHKSCCLNDFPYSFVRCKENRSRTSRRS